MIISCIGTIEVQEQFCFGDESTEAMVLRKHEVNVTRREPACDEASINLTLSFDVKGTTLSKLIQSVRSHLALYSPYTLIICLQISATLANSGLQILVRDAPLILKVLISTLKLIQFKDW